MKRYNFFLLPALLTIIFASCGSNQKSKISSTDIEQIVRLDSIVAEFNNQSSAGQDSLIGLYGEPLSDYLYMMGLTSPDLISSIDTLSRTAAFKVFLPDIADNFTASDSLTATLQEMESNIRRYLPEMGKAEYYGVTSPYRQSIMLVDSTVFVALNHYLGEEYEGYSSMPEYSRRAKTWHRIPYDILRARLAVDYDMRDNYEDVSQQLMHEGAVDYAMMRLVNNGEVGEMYAWTPLQEELVKKSEREIWETMVMRNLIYSTDPVDRTRLFEPSPSTSVISSQLPGEVGRYIGMRIIESYVKGHPNVTLAELLSPDFARNRDNFLSAGYSPQ